jgi:hypothetical protein
MARITVFIVFLPMLTFLLCLGGLLLFLSTNVLGFYISPNFLTQLWLGLTVIVFAISLVIQLYQGQLRVACLSGVFYAGIGGIVVIFLLFWLIYVPSYITHADLNQHKYYVLRTLVGIDPPEQMNHIYRLYQCDSFGIFCHSICKHESPTTQYDEPSQISIIRDAGTIALKYGGETLCIVHDNG